MVQLISLVTPEDWRYVQSCRQKYRYRTSQCSSFSFWWSTKKLVSGYSITDNFRRKNNLTLVSYHLANDSISTWFQHVHVDSQRVGRPSLAKTGLRIPLWEDYFRRGAVHKVATSPYAKCEDQSSDWSLVIRDSWHRAEVR